MPAIITQEFRNFSLNRMETIHSLFQNAYVYAFVGRNQPWENDELPPVPNDNPYAIIETRKNITGLKKLSVMNTIQVARRIDWVSGTVYDQYDDKVNLFDSEANFYVITSELNVYKCLSNNNGNASLNMPTGQSLSPFKTADNYKWKYLYTVQESDIHNNLLTSEWIPCKTLHINNGSSQWSVQQTSVRGTIDNIIVENGGSGYSSSSLPIITITGDGTGAKAVATVNSVDGSINSINITNAGSGYTYANITINAYGSNGSGAILRPVISPVGGHGSNPSDEIGAFFLMFVVTLYDNEGDAFPLDSTYRQVGLLANPRLKNSTYKKMIFSTNHQFIKSEQITGVTSGATGTVVLTDAAKGYIEVDVISGTFLANEMITNGIFTLQCSGISDVNKIAYSENNYVSDDIDLMSGNLLYYDNRTPITRLQFQKEVIRIVIKF
jgi:hypothetical protein